MIRYDQKAELLTAKIIEETEKVGIRRRSLLCELCELCVSFLEILRFNSFWLRPTAAL